MESFDLQQLDAHQRHEPAGSVLSASCRQIEPGNCRRDADSTLWFMGGHLFQMKVHPNHESTIEVPVLHS